MAATAAMALRKDCARQNFRRRQIFISHVDDALARLIGDLGALAIGRGNRGASGQRQAQRFGDRVHGRGRAHGVAMTDGRRRCEAASKNSSSVISPAASLRRLRQITVPEPTNSPSCQPSSIGPPDSTIAGISTAQAAMIADGVVLSQPVVSTTASIG